MLFDLAEAMTCTVDELENRMTERELLEWCVRSQTLPMWPRRLEVMLAQVAHAVARGPLHGDPVLRDFILFRDRENVETNTAEENGSLFAGIAGGGMKVRKLGQGRKARRDH